MEKVVKSEDCVCGEEDWECDLGFSRHETGPCKATDPSKENELINFKAPDECHYYYSVT